MTPIDLLLRIGATWLLAYSLTALDGPGGVFEWIREHVYHGRYGETVVAHGHIEKDGQPVRDHEYTLPDRTGLLDCIICTSTWVGVIVMLAPDGVLLQGFGVAGLAMFIHSYSGWKYSA